jgi:hypothetical protein
MIKNITYAFVLINLISSFLYLSSSHQDSSTPYEYLLLLQEPIAVDDEYETNQDETLAVEAPGVMENDDFGLSEVSSVLVDASLHPEVSLNPDGSFIYIPEEDFLGIYSFTYRLEHGDEISDPAVVQITVRDTQPPQLEWISPVPEGEVLIVESEIVQLEAGAMDNGLVTGVQFYRWDSDLDAHVLYDILETAPYQMELQAQELNFEWNQIFVRAFDESGNVSASPFIWLYKLPVDYLLYLPINFR